LFHIEEESIKQSNSITMPQPLIKNNNHIDKTYEFDVNHK